MKSLILMVLLNSSLGLAGEKIVETLGENFISHGYSDNPSKALAKQESCNTAKRELMAFVFGAAFQLNQNMIRSLGVLDYSQEVSVTTGEIVLRSAMTETAVSDGVMECLITYPVLEATIEKDRLKSAHNKTIRFAEIGDPNNLLGGVLEILTIPEDADVLIDNVRWGTTPLRLNGKLSTGTHTIILEKQNYKLVEETFAMSSSKTRIEKILKRATGKLKIITDPEGAAIKINEEEVAHSPTNEIELIAGQKLKVEITHPEAETNIIYLTLGRDEEKTINQKLLLKPAFISLNIVPNKAVLISTDGIERPKLLPNSWIQLEAGVHQISVSAENYAESTFSINLRGGEKKAMATINLTSLKEIAAKKLALEEKEKLAQQLSEEAEKIRLENEAFVTRYQFTLKPVVQDYLKKNIYIIPLGFSFFSSRRFSFGLEYKFTDEQTTNKAGQNVKLKSYYEVFINGIFWPIKSDFISFGFGPEFNYREINFDSFNSTVWDEKTNIRTFYRRDRHVALGGVMALQIELLQTQAGTKFGLEANYRRMDFLKKIDSQSYGIYFDY